MMRKIRVVVIDDSAFMRKIISDILTSDKRLEVIATARNGEEGIRKVKLLSPDVVTLDVQMPVMDGIEALNHLMKTDPVPVVMLSSVTGEGTDKTVQAISNGAVDFITKPSGPISLDIDSINQEIIDKVILASKVKAGKPMRDKGLPIDIVQKTGISAYEHTLVAIGTSTGGPRALQKVLTDLPSGFSTPLLIVQHMPKGFTKSLADRLNTLTSIHVKEAEHGEVIKKSTAYIAPGDYHMKVEESGTSIVIKLTKEAAHNGLRPAVDVLFYSLAMIKRNKVAVILTGMGTDGAIGITRLKENDPNTVVIAETEETAVVYGMPKAAVNTNCVNHVVPLYQIAETINRIVKK